MKISSLGRFSRLARERLEMVMLLLCILGAAANGQTQRKLDLKAARDSKLTILRATGATTVQAQQGSVRLRPTELLFERSGNTVTTTRVTDKATRLTLPFRFYGVKHDGADLDLAVVLDIDGGGLLPAGDQPAFVGRLHLGVIDQTDPTSNESLPIPVDFLVTADEGADVVPPNPRLTHTNLPFAAMTLTAATTKDSVVLHVRPSFALPDTVDFPLPVHRPTLELTPSPEAVLGLGLEEAVITVRVVGMMKPENASVILNSDRGHLENSEVTLRSDGTATTKIRSIGIGLATVRAQSSVLKTGETNLRFVTPWVFLIVAVVGGLVGTAARKLSPKLAAKDLLAGVCLGLLGAVAYAAGVNLTGYVLQASAGEVVTFFVSGIIAYTGSIKLK